MLAHGFAITYLPQKLEEHHQTTGRSDRSLRLVQFHFFSAPKSGNFPMHCFVLLGVSFIQLKLNRVRAKQCYSISEFRLSESYRIRVELREHEDAERQRRLANATLSSGIAAYETDLGTITRSETQQVQEILAAVGANGLDVVNQREIQFLKQLGESLPDLKSNAEKFIRLSDSFSQTEGEFVEKIFEPELRDEVTKTVRELASETDQGAGEYRCNIEKGLKDSCFTLEEASGVIASSAQKLFQGFSGAVLVFSASRNVLETNTTWGRSSQAERVFSPNES